MAIFALATLSEVLINALFDLFLLRFYKSQLKQFATKGGGSTLLGPLIFEKLHYWLGEDSLYRHTTITSNMSCKCYFQLRVIGFLDIKSASNLNVDKL